jgi:hypothetical protein
VHAGQSHRTVEDPQTALQLAQAAGDSAYVTVPSDRHLRPKIVWSPGLPNSARRL